MIRVDHVLPDGRVLKTLEIEDNKTIRDVALILNPDSDGKFAVPVIALVGDTPAVRDLGEWDIQLEKTQIQFRELALGGGGGGSNPLQIIFQVAVIAIAALATWYVGGMGGTFLGMDMLFWGGLAGAGVMLLGTLLSGVLFQNGLPSGQLGSLDAAAASPTYNINASGNQARLYQPEPEGFGRMKIVPDFVANTWTQYIDNDQYGYFVYGIGRGHYEIESLQFGETVFWRDGRFVGDSGYIEDGALETIHSGAQLDDSGSWCAPITVQNTQAHYGIAVVINFPHGLGRVQLDSSSVFKILPASASIRVQARSINAAGSPVGNWDDVGAPTWTAATNNSLNKVFSFSITEGRWEIRVCRGEKPPVSSLIFDDMVLSEIQLVPMPLEFVEPGQPVTIFPDNVESSTEVSGLTLFAPNDESYDGALGPYATNSAGTKTNQLLFDFILQQGIGRYDDRGDLKSYSVSWVVQYRKIDDFGVALSDWATLENCSFSDATLTPQRFTKKYTVADGRYEVRVRRTSETTGDGRTLDALIWGGLRAILPGSLSYPISCIAFSVKATNKLSQTASQRFSAIVTRKLPLYDRETKTWSAEVATRSWAAAVSHVCKASWGGRITDANIDLDTLWAIDERLQAKKWFYDAYIDGPYLVWNLVNEMCQSQCVLPRFVGPILSFVEDAPNRAPSFALTPRNIVRNTFSVTYRTWSDDTPDDVNVEYLDADYGFQQRDVTAVLPESESNEPAVLSILGITDRSHAHKVAVAYAAHNRWQRVMVECQVEALGRVINRGDVCTVAHPRFKNTASGAVREWDESKLEITLIQDMTRLLPEGSGKNLYIALTKQDGSIWGPCLLESLKDSAAKLASGDYSNLLLQGQENPFEWMTSGIDRQPTTWTLYTGKTYQRLMVVESVTTQDALHYNLKLANYDERIYQYGNLAVPPWTGRTQLPNSDVALTAPANFSAVIKSNTEVLLVWAVVPGASGYDVETSQNGTNFVNRGRANINQMSVTVPSGLFYARVRAVNDTRQSSWSAVLSVDSSIPVPAAPSLAVTKAYSDATAEISWSAVTYAKQYAVSLSDVANGNTFYTEKTTQTKFTVTPEIQEGGPYRSLTVSVASVGERGTSSASTVSLTDQTPVEVTSATIVTGKNSIQITATEPSLPADGTGYVIAKGETPTFSITQVTDVRMVNSLPYTWVDLATGTHYFRIAMRDGFFDVSRNLLALNWSAVLPVTVA